VAAGRRAPLAEIFLIAPEHAADSREPLRLSTVTPAAAAAALLAQTFLRVLEPASLARLLPTVEEVAANARIRRLDFVPVPEIWSCLDDRCR
jgi:hypothetical protein